jgi:O-methyltransferase
MRARRTARCGGIDMLRFVKSVVKALPPVGRLLAERNALRGRLAAAEAALRERERALALYTTGLCYEADGMRLYGKNVSFLDDERFRRAYQAGMDSGHKISRPPGSRLDIRLEWRVHVACWAASHALHLEGDFVECGVNTGIFSLAVCHYTDFNSAGKSFYLFDTFCGIPEEQMLDTERPFRVAENESMYEECYETARRNFRPFPRARLVRGKVPDTLTRVRIDKVSYLSLDMNIAAPEVAAIEFFWDRLVGGALVVLDDYGWAHYFEQKKALDAFAARKGVAIATLPTGQGLLLKP